MAFLDPILNPVLQPLLNWSPFWGIMLLSFLISLVITLVYKFFTNQEEMKRLKEEQKEFQKRMKELRDKPEELLHLQKEAMRKNFDYMKHSLKATLITMLPILLLFGWMSAHLMYEPIYPGETYSITADLREGITGQVELIADEGTEITSSAAQDVSKQVTWNLKSTTGEHFLTVKLGETQQTKKVLITTEVAYEQPVVLYEHSDIEKIQVNHKKLRPAGDLSFFGWEPGWLGWYIISSIVFSMAMRKVLKIY